MCVSVRPCVHIFNMNISETSGPIAFKFYLKHHWGGERDCIRFWGISIQNSGSHGKRKFFKGYNGENVVATFSRLFFIRSVLYLT